MLHTKCMAVPNICSGCGAPVPRGAKFCINCGTQNPGYVENDNFESSKIPSPQSKLDNPPPLHVDAYRAPIRQKRKLHLGWWLVSIVVVIAIIGAISNKSGSSSSSSSSQLNLTAASPSASAVDTSWIPSGFTGTVTGDPNIVWKVTNTSGDPAYDKEWCSDFGPGSCFFYRVAVNENCSSISGTLQLLNSLGEVEDSTQASSAAAVSKGGTTTLVFQPNNWKGTTKLSNLGCVP